MLAATLTRLATTYTYNYNYTTSSGHVSGTVLAILWLFILVFVVLMIASMWKVFVKAGRPGWAAIIPVYNSWVLFEIAGKPGWWALLGLIPIVNLVYLVMYIMVCIEVAKRFGKSSAFGFFLLFLLPFIGWPILAFNDAHYQGSGSSDSIPPVPTPPVSPANPIPPTDTNSVPPTNVTPEPPTTPAQ